MGFGDWVQRVIGTWCTPECIGGWHPDDDLRQNYPPRHSDFRDTAPPPLNDVHHWYDATITPTGRWTLGLFEMWFPKAKPVKHATHIPCWDSFHFNPFRWRGMVAGRTCRECYWVGLRQTRWARMAYASNLGREYVLPVQGVGRHGYQSEIKALCWLYCLLGCVFSCGIGQIFSLCGNAFINFAACYSCHGRYKIRKKYQLPPAFCLPPLLDDFLVHFFCLYCASYQEMRELAIRGIDGPGMHVLDLLPESFVGAAGAEEAVEERRDMVIQYMKRPLTFFNKEGTVVVPATADIKGGTTDVGAVGAGDMNVKAFPAAMFSATKMTAQAAAANILGRPSENAIDGTTADDGGGTEGGGGGVGGTEGGVQFHEFGWWRYCENSQGRAVIPPQQLEMDRRRVRVLEEDEDGSLRPPSRAWSVAY